MYYSTIDFHDSLMDCEFDPNTIEQVLAAWGEEGEPWSGGFCFKTLDDHYYRLVKHEDGTAMLEIGDEELEPLIEDYEGQPVDLQSWVDEGSPEGNLLSF